MLTMMLTAIATTQQQKLVQRKPKVVEKVVVQKDLINVAKLREDNKQCKMESYDVTAKDKNWIKHSLTALYCSFLEPLYYFL